MGLKAKLAKNISDTYCSKKSKQLNDDFKLFVQLPYLFIGANTNCKTLVQETKQNT